MDDKLTASADERGTVVVRIRDEAPVERSWRALRDPVEIVRWFGELDRPWLAGRSGRIDFGDGDFFDFTTIEVVEDKRIEFTWSFLGVGSVARITWATRPLPGGSEITVEDRDPQRTASEAAQLMAGWTDFFERLGGYLATGEPTRYDWRGDIDGSVDLPGTFDPLEHEMLTRWLPMATDGFAPRWFFVVDDEGPRRFRIESWNAENADELAFRIALGEGEPETACQVRVDEVPGGRRCRPVELRERPSRAIRLSEHGFRIPPLHRRDPVVQPPERFAHTRPHEVVPGAQQLPAFDESRAERHQKFGQPAARRSFIPSGNKAPQPVRCSGRAVPQSGGAPHGAAAQHPATANPDVFHRHR
ncbi:SRPBCC family protein [Amycolatopsis speibonae]|uniref:SRPBCC domain-containing protein n=1 Tax=Amycolatopsis speibonae TaxID=1450224 RepID=A0ABV7NS59_9PSEU